MSTVAVDGKPDGLDSGVVAVSSSTNDDGIVELLISELLDVSIESEAVADRVRRINVRGGLNRERVDAYKLALKRGVTLPPIDVVEIDGKPFVASGWHRTTAYAESERDTIPGRVRQATFAEAVFDAVHANNAHGHSPTVADVAKSLEMMWQVRPEMLRWSNVRLAAECGVSEGQVRKAHALLPAGLRAHRESQPREAVRNGKPLMQTMPSSSANEDGWQAKKPAPAPASEREQARAMSTALRYSEQALEALHTAGVKGLPDGVAKEFAYGIKPEVLAAKAATAAELAAWLMVAAQALRGKAA